jgi:hypothetical protein|tara:strand:+ start:7639 stop:8160 length:522 start_codon:yes stop_codon:yes gene_type:complete
MSAVWLQDQPDNRNFLSPVGFKMKIDIFPGVDFFCQSANIPGITAQVNEVSTSRRRLPIPAAGGTTFDDLTVQFLVDEDLKNYLSIWNWINDTTLAYEPDDSKEPQFSNAQLFVLTNNFNTNFVVNFDSLFPVSLNTLAFNAGANDVEYLIGTVTFKYGYYEFLNLSQRKYEP